MKFNKKLLSIFLTVLMLVSTLGNSVFAVTQDLETNIESGKTPLEGRVEGDKKVFTLDLSKLTKKAESKNTKAMPARVPRREPVQYDTTVNITATGLNGKIFDWDALPNKEFKLIARYKTTDGQSHTKVLGPFTDADTKYLNIGWPVDNTMVGTADIEADFNQKIDVRVLGEYQTSTGGAGKLVFDIELTELAEPRAEVKYVDPYGRAITDPDDLPTGTMPKVTAPELTNVEIDLPNSSKEINMRNHKKSDEDELNEAENGLTFKVDNKTTGETVTIYGKDYKLDISAPNAKQVGTIKMIYQKDVVIPPTKDDGSGEPVDVADGYVRLTFDANEKVDPGKTGITGKHTAGAYAGQQLSYIDVRNDVNNPVKYNNANLQREIKALLTTGTKEVNGKKKEYTQDTKNPWTPAVKTDTTPVVKATYNAQYTKDIAEQIKEAGGIDPQDIVVWKDTPVANITWKDGTKLAAGVTDQTLKDAYANATFTEATVPARQTNEAKTLPGKIKVEFADGSSIIVGEEANKPQNLIVAEHKNEVTDPQNPPVVPKDAIEVEFKLGEGTKLGQKTGDKKTPVLVKTMLVKPDTTLVDADFPAAEKTNANAHDVVWTPDDKKVTANNKTFIATSSENVPATKNSEDYDPHYKDKSGKPGETVQIDKPTFTKKGETGTVPAPTNGTKKTTFAKNGVTLNNVNVNVDVDVDSNTGVIKVEIPQDAKVGDIIVVSVDVTYPDGSNETVDVTITVIDKVTPPSYNYLTLTLDENYRGGEITNHDVYYGDLIEHYLYVPRRRGYVFEGWSYNSRRLDEVRPGDRIEYSTILYAIWSKQKPKDDEEVEPIDTREVGEHKAYMFGYTDGTVRPNGYITRAEAAALVTRLLGLDTFASAAEPAFTDTPSSWYNKAINAAVQRGIMKGYPDKSFRPNAPITRAEFTQMISTIDNKPYGVAPFADVVGHWAERPIGSEYQAGRIKGYPDGTFRPNAFITRAEAVVILNKIFERNYDAMSAMNAKNKEYIKRFIDLAPSFWGFNDMVEATNTHLFKRRVKGAVQEDWTEVK